MNKNTLIGTVLVVVLMVGWFGFAGKAKNETVPEAAQVMAPAASVQGEAPQNLPANAVPAAPIAVAASTAEADSSVEVAPAKVITPRTVVVETDHFVMTLTNKGARVQSVVAKVLPDSAGNFPELIQDTALGALNLKLGAFDLGNVLFDAGETPEKIVVGSDTTVQFVFNDGASSVIRSYHFTQKGVSVRQSNKFLGFQPRGYDLAMDGGLKETEVIPGGRSFGGNSYFFSEVIFNDTKNVEREVVTDNRVMDNSTGRLSWAGLRRKYVAMTMQFDSPIIASMNVSPMPVLENESDPGTYHLNVRGEIRSDSLAYDLMVLPLEWKLLESFDRDYEKVIVSGWRWCGADVWFVWICKMLLKLLNLFYSIIPNYGVAIIIVTFIVRGITTPFTVKQMRSTSAMSKLKPQLDEINVKYRSDPQKKQAAIMELYQKNGVNPLASCTGGCLPMLFQMPIFMGLFFVLGRAIELRGQPAFLWITDLSRSDVVFSGFSIPFIMPAGLALLPLIMVVTTYFQTKVTMGGNAGMDPAQQKMMVWMMPAMMFLFSAVMPSGLVLYWIVSNIWSIAQYKIIRRDQDGSTGNKKVKGKKVMDAEIVK